MTKRDVSIDHDLQAYSGEKKDRRFSILKPSSRAIGSRQSMLKSINKSNLASKSVLNEDNFEDESTEKEKRNLDRSFHVLESLKNNHTVSPLKSTTLPTIEKRGGWKEKVENSLLEASQYINQDSWGSDNPHVEGLLRKYGVAINDL